MSRDDVIRMAKKAGFVCDEADFVFQKPGRVGIQLELERFANLVRADERKIVMNEPLTKEMWQRFEDEIRADEREACAKVCDDIDDSHWGCEVKASWCSREIRARGETKCTN